MSGPLNFLRSLSFRLTVYYAIVLIFALTIVYIVSYFLVFSLESRRVDKYLGTQVAECTRIYQEQGQKALAQRADEETVAVGREDLFFQVFDKNGNIIFQTDPARFDVKHAKLSGLLVLHRVTETDFRTIDAPHDAPARIVTTPLSGGNWLSITVSMSDDLQLINASMRLILLVMLVAGVAAVVLGFIISRNALSGILQVQRAADDLAGGRINRRAPVLKRGDEVDRLAGAFNIMAERVEALLTQLRDANDQLAHELRSPLTRIRGRAELALTHAEEPQTLQAVAGETVEACDRLLRTINTILEMSETDSGMTTLPRESVPLDALLQNACDLFTPLAQDAGISLTVDTPPASVVGAGAKLQRLFSNLLDNAIKYTPREGKIAVTLSVEDGSAVVSVRDSGRGIDAADLPHIFERFYRGQGNDGIAGNGLGLPLARSIARAHGGEITVVSKTGTGTEFRVTLPLQNMTEK